MISTPLVVTPPTQPATEALPECYQFLYRPGLDPNETAKVMEALPFAEIQLERTTCFGPCPSYIITLKSNGAAEYVGREHVSKIGLHSGKIDPWNYARICLAIEKFKLPSGPRQYRANWTDCSTTLIRFTRRNTVTAEQISDYGSQGPIELWAVFTVIDAIASEIEWTKVMPDDEEGNKQRAL